MRVFSGVTHSLSLSLARALRYATTTTTTTLTTQDVQETCVKLGFLYPNAKTSDPVQRRADCVTMFRVVGCTCASTLFWCLSPPRPFLSPFFLSLERAARYTLLHVYERWCAYACAVCTNARASPHFTCHAGLSRRSNLPGRTKNFPRRTWDDPARLGKRPRGERRSHVENLRRGRIQPPLCLLRRSKNHEMETRSQTWRPSDQNG